MFHSGDRSTMGRRLSNVLSILVAQRQLSMPEMFPSLHEGEETTHAGSQHGLCTKGGQGRNFISLKNSLGLHVISNQFHSTIKVTVARVRLY